MNRQSIPVLFLSGLLLLSLAASPAAAVVMAGDTGPNFTKDRLDFPAPGLTTPVSIYDYSGKVIVLFILGST